MKTTPQSKSIKRLKKLGKVFAIIALLLICFLIYFYFAVKIDPPNLDKSLVLESERTEIAPNTFQIKNNWLRKNQHGLWELYVEGKPYERGYYIGKLSEELMHKQEEAFINGLRDIVPSDGYLNFLKYIVAWQNRNLTDYVQAEYLQEIYGLSGFLSDEFDFIGPKYHRKISLHAAHDIGHTLQNMGLVGGCTSFSVWDEQSADSSLLLARNFDFYVGDGFAENKVLLFMRPDMGYPFMMYSWPGMIGTVSGMNLEGLAITLNAGPSAIPGSAKTPISLLAREILQYASNIEEAYEIAQKRETFISENLIIASAKDNKTILIEKTPEQTVLVDSPQSAVASQQSTDSTKPATSNQQSKTVNSQPTTEKTFICSNHFLSPELSDSETNKEAKIKTSTIHRYERMTELVEQYSPIDQNEAATILRDQNGLDNKVIGMGNEMAINQLIAHHSIIFQPQKKLVWVSTKNWQLGAFIAYDLEQIFDDYTKTGKPRMFLDSSLTIAPDTILQSQSYKNFLLFRGFQKIIKRAIENDTEIPTFRLAAFEQWNPEHYLTYESLGNYYASRKDCKKAKMYYEKALTKEIPWKQDREGVLEKIGACE